MNRDERIVVVGGGLTGLRAAERLRELKFEGDITILGDEKLPPYHRPALSKQLLQGSLRPSDLTLPAYEDLNARWRFGTQVRQLIPSKKTLVLPGGEEMTYDGLIIATGVEATRQSGVPYHDPRVLVLRTMSDGLDLERVVGSTKGRIAVIGGGFTGCELAASLRHLSREVTLIGRGKNLLGNVLGPDLGEWLTAVHRDHGVDLALGNSVEEWNPTSEGIGLKLTDGSTLMVSCVILAAGTKPMTHWLRGSGLPLDNGVVCEPTCHVVGADDVVAAGDVAQWPNLRFDNVPRRVEHWLNAVEMGRAAAESLLAGRAAAEPFAPMPRFWTDQYSFRIQAAGMVKLGKDIVKLGTPDEGTGTVYGYSLEGRLMAVVGVDCPGAMISWAESVGRQNPAPRPRVPEEVAKEAKVPVVTVGGPKKKGAGNHRLPVKDKQFKREDRPQPEIGYVEGAPAPSAAEISGPVGVGTGRVPIGRPQNVVDSFSRMLPVAVRPPGEVPPPPGMPGSRAPQNGRAQQNGRSPAGAPPRIIGAPAESGPIARPANGVPAARGPRGPINAPFGDGASQSGVFRNAPNGNSRPNGRANGTSSRLIAASNNGHTNGTSSSTNGIPTNPLGVPIVHSQRLLGPATPPTSRIPAQSQGSGPIKRPGALPVPIPPPTPEFSAAEMTDVRNGFPPPLAGRMSPDGLAIDVTGQMALHDANGRVRRNDNQDFSDPLEDAYNLPSRRGTSDSFSNIPAVSRAANGSRMRGPEESFGAMQPAQPSRRALPPARGPESSFGGMPPASSSASSASSRGTGGRRRAEDSHSSMPPAARNTGGGRMRGPEESFGSMPPARPSTPATNGRSTGGRRRAEDSHTRMPAARQDSYSALPPARQDSHSALPAVRREDSYSALPPARRDDDTYVSRRDSYDRLPAVDTSRRAAHRAEDLTPEFGRPQKRRSADPDQGSSRRLVPAMSSVEDSMPPARMPKHGRPEDYGHGSSSHSGPEDSYDQLPVIRAASGGRRRRGA